MPEGKKVVQCADCGELLEISPKLASTNKDVLCQECGVETKCINCGRGLLLTKEAYATTNGQPVCTNCASSSKSRKLSSGIIGSIKRLGYGIFGLFAVLLLLRVLLVGGKFILSENLSLLEIIGVLAVGGILVYVLYVTGDHWLRRAGF